MTSGLLPAARDRFSGAQSPVSIEAEQAALGAILTNPDAYAAVASIVKTEHFSEEIHRRIFDVMGQLLQAGRPITINGLITFLGDHELAEGVNTRVYLARLSAAATTVILAPEDARVVRDMATRRALIFEGQALVRRATDALVDAPPESIASDSLEAMRSLLEGGSHQRSRFSLAEGAVALLEHTEAIRRGEIVPRSMKTGFGKLDHLLGGLHPGTIVLVAARVAMGKKIVMTSIGYGVARHNEGIGVLEFSLEVPEREIVARHLASLVFDLDRPIPFVAIRDGRYDDADAERLFLAEHDLRNRPITIESPAKISAAELVGRIQVEKRMMAARGVTLGVVLIDYLDKIGATDRYAGQRTYEIQEIVTALKSAARSEDVCIVLLAQLNRGTEGREDKRPSLADLKSSSFLEQEAHAVIFVYREAYYLLKSPEYRDGQPEAELRYLEVQHDVELIIGKNRSGPEATVNLWGDVACSYLASGTS